MDRTSGPGSGSEESQNIDLGIVKHSGDLRQGSGAILAENRKFFCLWHVIASP
jgi:hypothetical protein